MGRVVTDKSPAEILQLIDDFFMKKDDVHQTMYRVIARLQDEQIPYALIGGLALGFHGFVRVTGDVDILTTPDGLEAVHQKLVGRGYLPTFPGGRKKLRDTQTGITVDFITTGEYPGDGKPKAVRFPEPLAHGVEIDGRRVLSLEKIIEIKLASGLTNPQRVRDIADVHDLVEHLGLPLGLAEKLDPSVRDKYIEIWHINQSATGPDRE
jgi:hypothetical protein